MAIVFTLDKNLIRFIITIFFNNNNNTLNLCSKYF